MKAASILALASSTVNGLNYGTCFYGSGLKNQQLGFATAIGDGDTSTDCYASSVQFGEVIDTLVEAFDDLDTSSWTAPIQTINDLGIEFTDLATSCRYIVMSQQLKPRISTLHGFFEFVATFVLGYFAWTPLFDQGVDGISSASSCNEFGTGMGYFMSYALIYEAPDSVFYNDVIESVDTYINN